MRAVEIIESSSANKTTNSNTESSKESVRLDGDNQKVQQVKELPKAEQSKPRELIRADANIPQTGNESSLPTYLLGISAVLMLLTMVHVIRRRMKTGDYSGK